MAGQCSERSWERHSQWENCGGKPYGVVSPTLGTVLVVESRSSPKGRSG